MSYQPIVGIDPAKPVTTPDGLNPVCMASPIPYSQGDATVTIDSIPGEVTVTTGAFWIKSEVVKDPGVVGRYSGRARFKMIATAASERLYCVLSESGNNDNAVTKAQFRILADGVEVDSLTLYRGGTTSGYLDAPYYRYQVEVLVGGGTNVSAGAYVKGEFSIV